MFGIATVPIVAALASEDPEVAANTALEAMLVWMSCPGTRANHGASAVNNRSEMPERCINSPIMMNIGAAIRTKSLEWLHASSPAAPVNGTNAN